MNRSQNESDHLSEMQNMAPNIFEKYYMGMEFSQVLEEKNERIKCVLPKTTHSIFRPCRIYGSEEKRSLCENQKRLFPPFFFSF